MNRIILAALLAAGVALSAQAQTYQDFGGTVVPEFCRSSRALGRCSRQPIPARFPVRFPLR